jgi:hypothetical protein
MFANVATMTGGITENHRLKAMSQTSRHQVSVAKYTALPDFVFIDELFYHL